MGTVSGYAQRVPPRKYSPPNEQVAAEIAEVVALYRERQEIDEKYRARLAFLADKENGRSVPIATLAAELGIERKTVYRHLGRSMT